MHSHRLYLPLFFVLFLMGAIAQEGHVHTSREKARLLPLPKAKGVFHFAIFGDRTGGPASGIKVLAQAVKDVNLLDPDMVLTVGDLVQGYTTTKPWQRQAKEYSGVMKGLRMSWYPVPGNHDIYWRGKGRPTGENEENYEAHFGPLWYWFKHKNAGFIVLYSDEGNPKTGKKSFGDPACQAFSQRQLEWLTGALEKTKGQDHVFLFMHHPRWEKGMYPGSNWDKVHARLVKAGNVSAVFAGHIHHLLFSGKKDGIAYHALATTGGAGGHFPGGGYVHQMNIVTVRKGGISVAAIPVGAVLDPKKFTMDRVRDLDRLRAQSVSILSGPGRLGPEGEGKGEVVARFKNPVARQVVATFTLTVPSPLWTFAPAHQHFTINPGETRTVKFTWLRRPGPVANGLALPKLKTDLEYLGRAVRVAVLPKEQEVNMIPTVPAGFFGGGEGVLALDGRGDFLKILGVQLSMPPAPLTLEARIKPLTVKGKRVILARGRQGAMYLALHSGRPFFSIRNGKGIVSLHAPDSLAPKNWVHLAAVVKAGEIGLYVDGNLVAKKNWTGARKAATQSLLLGAVPDRWGNPADCFQGLIDEVRISGVARYGESGFTPARTHTPDAKTLLLLHLDRNLGQFAPDQSAHGAHARIFGNGQIKR